MPKKTPSHKPLDPAPSLLGKGLLPTPKDVRDFSLGAVYGLIDIKTVPRGNFNLPQPLKIKNQLYLDFCAAFMATEVSEDQEGVVLGALWQFAMIKEIMGEWQSWGADLRSAMLSPVKVGSIPVEVETEFLSRQGYLAEDRDFLANWENWPANFKEIAKKHCKQSMFEIKPGKYDAFDTIRAALWQHRKDKCSVGLGTMWRYNWNDAVSGIIPDEAVGDGEGHALKAFDHVVINKVGYLAIQNSWGDEVGNGGVFYASRAVFNKYFSSYGFFMLKDMPVPVAKFLIENNLTVKSVWWARIVVAIRDLFTRNAQ